jgi:hypothetical protein
MTCDMDRIVTHTNFTACPVVRYELSLDDLATPRGLAILRAVFFDPEALRPGTTCAASSGTPMWTGCGRSMPGASRGSPTSAATGSRRPGRTSRAAAADVRGSWPPGQEPIGDPLVVGIGAAAADLCRLRDAWLNLPEWTREEVLEFPATLGGPWDRSIVNPRLPPDAPGVRSEGFPASAGPPARAEALSPETPSACGGPARGKPAKGPSWRVPE